MNHFINEYGIALFMLFLASQGAGVLWQIIVGFLLDLKSRWGSLGTWSNPMKRRGNKTFLFWEFMTEIFSVIVLIFFVVRLTDNTFRHTLGDIWQEEMGALFIVGLTALAFLSEAKPSWEEKINRHTTMGVVWILSLIILSWIGGSIV